MNMKNSLKTLPVIAALAIGLALAPMTSMAKGDRHESHQSERYSHDGGKHHKKSHKRRGDAHDRDSRGHKHGHKMRHAKQHRHGYKHGHKHGHKHRGHKHRGHRHDRVVFVDNYDHYDDRYGFGRDYRDRYIDLDDLRFMVGIHTGNFDLIFRD